MPLSAKPVLGEWKLTASSEGFASDVVATFEVDEYVLPRYEVVIDVPPTISEEEAARGVTGKIHGLYTYGEKVVGKARLELWKESDMNPPPRFGGGYGGRGGFGGGFGFGGGIDAPPDAMPEPEEPEPVATLDVVLTNDAATEFSFDLVDRDAIEEGAPVTTTTAASSVNAGGAMAGGMPFIMGCFRCRIAPWMQQSWGEKLIVKAVVTEGPTGVEQEAESTITTAKYPFNHKFEMDRDFFIRGLPFTGSLTITKLDGTPAITKVGAEGTLLTPTVTANFGSSTEEVPCTLQAGTCQFSVTVPFSATTVKFDVTDPVGNFEDSSGKQTSSTVNSESKSGSYLRIAPKQGSNVPAPRVGGQMALVAAATTSFSSVHWNVVANGKLVASGKQTNLKPTCSQNSRDKDCKCLEYVYKARRCCRFQHAGVPIKIPVSILLEEVFLFCLCIYISMTPSGTRKTRRKR